MIRLVPILLLVGCGPVAERADLEGLWGRVVDGEHEIWQFAEEIDATGLTDVRPAFLMYRYPLDEVPFQVKRGRWDVLDGDLIVTPTWSLTDGEANRTIVWEIEDFTSRQIELLAPDQDEPYIYTTLTQLPQPRPE